MIILALKNANTVIKNVRKIVQILIKIIMIAKIILAPIIVNCVQEDAVNHINTHKKRATISVKMSIIVKNNVKKMGYAN